MATAGLLVGSMLIALGPHAVAFLVFLVKYPQLCLIALTGSAMYFMVPIVATSLWRLAIGESAMLSAEGFFSAWMAILVECARYVLCRLVVKAEAEFQAHDQTICSTRHHGTRRVPVAVGIAAGLSIMQAALTVGVVGNAEVALTWIDHGSDSGSWMTAGSNRAAWVDVSSCPQLARLLFICLHSLLASGACYSWSIVMMEAVSALQESAPSLSGRRVPASGTNDRDGVSLTNLVSTVAEAHHDELPATSSTTTTTTHAPQGSMNAPMWTRGQSYLAIGWICVSHALYRWCSLLDGNAVEYDATTESWTSNLAMRGCGVSLALQASIVVGSAGLVVVMWRRMRSME